MRSSAPYARWPMHVAAAPGAERGSGAVTVRPFRGLTTTPRPVGQHKARVPPPIAEAAHGLENRDALEEPATER